MSTALDHIILLHSSKDFDNVPSWLSSNFNIIEGGTHSKGTSHNKLIIFKDGSYLELFSWVDPQPEGASPHADFPSWASRPEGYIIDWALTGDDAQANYKNVTSRLSEYNARQSQSSDLDNVTYDEPKSGGRRRKDGKELQWMTTRPRRSTASVNDQAKRLDVPFFCHDVTERSLRVPYNDAAITTHPCGAVGVASITVAVPESQLEQYRELYSAILGASNESSTGEFSIDVPVTLPDSAGQCLLKLQSERSSDPFFEGSGIGIQQLRLVTEKSSLKNTKLDQTGLGAFVELC